MAAIRALRCHTRAPLVGCALLIAVFAPRAEAQKVVPPAITWCDALARKPEWAAQNVYLQLFQFASPEPLSRDALENIVIAVATQIRALPGLTEPASDAQGMMLPLSGTRYLPPALFGDVQFQMTQEGNVGQVVFHDVRDSTLAHDIRVALRSAGATAPNAAANATRRFHGFMLKPTFVRDTSVASFPLFRMLAPRSRNAALVKRSHKELPPEFREWDVGLTLLFAVDTTGSIVPETIRSTPAPETIRFKNPQEHEMFLRYIETAKMLASDSKFSPGEYLGCRVPQNVSFDVSFRAR